MAYKMIDCPVKTVLIRTYIFSLSSSYNPRVVHRSENVYYLYKFTCPSKYTHNKSCQNTKGIILWKKRRRGGIFQKKNLTKLRKCCLWLKT